MSQFANPSFGTATTPVVPTTMAETNNLTLYPKPLDDAESDQINKLLADNVQPEISDAQMNQDSIDLQRITSEIIAVGKEGAVLLGERAYKAHKILKPYKNGTFTKWLQSCFGTRKTGYNMLAYYQLFIGLNEDVQDKLKKLPQRTAYMLASKDCDINVKSEIISEHYTRTHGELVDLIQKRLPLKSGDGRKSKGMNSRIIADIRGSIQKLKELNQTFTEAEIRDLDDLRQMIDALFSDV